MINAMTLETIERHLKHIKQHDMTLEYQSNSRFDNDSKLQNLNVVTIWRVL